MNQQKCQTCQQCRGIDEPTCPHCNAGAASSAAEARDLYITTDGAQILGMRIPHVVTCSLTGEKITAEGTCPSCSEIDRLSCPPLVTGASCSQHADAPATMDDAESMIAACIPDILDNHVGVFSKREQAKFFCDIARESFAARLKHGFSLQGNASNATVTVHDDCIKAATLDAHRMLSLAIDRFDTAPEPAMPFTPSGEDIAAAEAAASEQINTTDSTGTHAAAPAA